MNFSEFARKWNRAEDNNFASACYDSSQAELSAALENGADTADMEEWGITALEWTDAVQTAINEKQKS